MLLIPDSSSQKRVQGCPQLVPANGQPDLCALRLFGKNELIGRGRDCKLIELKIDNLDPRRICHF
jgi:hypothetical protein